MSRTPGSRVLRARGCPGGSACVSVCQSENRAPGWEEPGRGPRLPSCGGGCTRRAPGVCAGPPHPRHLGSVLVPCPVPPAPPHLGSPRAGRVPDSPKDRNCWANYLSPPPQTALRPKNPGVPDPSPTHIIPAPTLENPGVQALILPP